ncbi:MAG: phage holin family protein [Patescibacteria group bacterium]|nr:phage holin family protein [Patescibacteria group bacterium]
MLLNILLQVVAGIGGLWIAVRYIPLVELEGTMLTLVYAGILLGLINAVIKPILKMITLPIRLLTLGLFGLVINILMVWVVDIVFVELIITGLMPLLWTTLVVWGMSVVLAITSKGRIT